ncbi:MAG: hypothetical protein AB1716_08380 [Planctomycetota bacterium]
MHKRSLRWLRVACLLLTSGTALQIGSCGLGDVGHFIADFNPCGTILNCDPVTYRFIQSGYEGPGADPDIDPACTYPPFCPGDPFVSSTGQDGTTSTGNTSFPSQSTGTVGGSTGSGSSGGFGGFGG